MKDEENTYGVDPEERADTTARRTRWHTRWNLKVREPRPDASLVDTENREILRLNRRNIALIRNGQCTPLEIVQSVRMIFLRGGIRTNVIRVVLITNIAPFGGCKERSGAFVAGDFCGGWFAGWEFEDVTGVRGEIKVVVKPPLGEGHVFNGRDWSVVVREGFVCNVEPKHAWMPES